MNKTALMIAYYFPPMGMGGVQRMAKLARYLPQFGYDVIVLTVKPIRYPANDESLLDELPAEVKIYRSGSSDPARIGKFIPLPLRAATKVKTVAKEKSGYFWPDSKIGWKRSALKLAGKIAVNRKIDVTISSSPPITAHLIAMALKNDQGIPWVADFRDPWESRSPEELYRDQALVNKSHLLLREIVEAADAVTSINGTISAKLSSNAATIMGGYDPADFAYSHKINLDVSFTMCYMGTVGPLHPIGPFFKAAAIASGIDDEFKARVRFKIIGANNADEIKNLAAAHGMQRRLELIDYLPHQAALQQAASAAVSLISVPEENPEILTGKIFDYLALPAPILASVPSGGEIFELINSCRGGVCIEPDNKQALAEAMLQLFRNHQSSIAWQKGDIAQYTRQEVARQFADIFNRICNG